MPKLIRLKYQTWSEQERSVSFVVEGGARTGCHTTILTGRNGSHKSSILKDLVAALSLSDMKAKLQLSEPIESSLGAPIVICASGSVADRFPPKENGGRFTEYAVPGYVYLGQRVGNNLLSKKRSLETALTFALDEASVNRYGWSFFSRACQLAGIEQSFDLSFVLKPAAKKQRDILGGLLEDARNDRMPSSKKSGRSGREVPVAIARYLLDEFTYEEFNELDTFIRKRAHHQLKVSMLGNGLVQSSLLSRNAIRLGLLADVMTLDDAMVYSFRSRRQLSAFDLSSGEYHLLSTIMGIGFSVRQDSIVLIDEPENSLHPQWQQEFMECLFDISEFMTRGHMVVSTHSPLIVSSAKPGTSIIDLGSDLEAASTLTGYGASADEVLFEQFGIASSRNRQVIEIVQRAVELVESGRGGAPEFLDLTVGLADIKARLRSGDPLIDVIDELIYGGVE